MRPITIHTNDASLLIDYLNNTLKRAIDGTFILKKQKYKKERIKKKKKTGKNASEEMKVHERGRGAVLRNQV